MSEKQTTILGFLTLIVVLVAVWLLFGERHAGPAEELRDSALFPGLSERVDEIAGIVIEKGEVRTALRAGEQGWTVAERAGYPADMGKIRELVSGLAGARILLAKTSNPELYGRIGLGEAATSVTLTDAAGESLAALDVGQREYRNRGFASFVLREGEARSLLVTRLPEIDAEPASWLPRQALSIPRTRIARVRIRHADGEEVAIARPTPEAEFTLDGMGEDEQLKGFRPLDPVALAFNALVMSDARPAGEIAGRPLLAEVEAATFDGLALRVALHDPEDATGDAWATIRASWTAPDESEIEADILRDVPPDGAAEAAAIGARHEGWAVRLNSTAAANLLRRRDDLVEPVPEPEEAGEDGP